MRTACESCHERKLRCVMLRCGTCLHCYNRKRVCKPREKKRRGRQQNRQNMVLMSDGQGHVFAVPTTGAGGAEEHWSLRTLGRWHIWRQGELS